MQIYASVRRLALGAPAMRVLHGVVAAVAYFFCNFTTLEAVLLDVLLDLGSRMVATALAWPDASYVASKYVRLKDPEFHLEGEIPHIRFDLSYTTNLTSISKLFHNPELFHQLEAATIRPAMRRVLPSFVLEQSLTIHDNCLQIQTTSCSICWDSVTDNRGKCNAAHHLPCGHGFHLQCIREWMKRDSTCPLCRRSLPSVQDTFEIDHVATKLVPRNARLSRGEMVVMLKRRAAESGASVDGFPIRCTVDGRLPSRSTLLHWRRRGMISLKRFIRKWLREYVIHFVVFAMCYKGLLISMTWI
ncbi:hypothetical protein H310_07077 [Aphanomyces invadans]|uniref:RING-type domain-containing protein n=1 Tax=Aphanomyces invadans TaxID=157072 RepID=A0A024U3K0_9STRA|nr:hypothetical protein H310_07077 [Aphanomyces invadans]ETW00452.1 hypothetical protein H310_07077 [Aphanomyces invadans]|eukprot:XP_008870587.1 hypothetical protein H310_07077 [Aphanomyces invadans]